jgi:uncharacterized protein
MNTFPGVFIDELPSGVRTIMGVDTSITAFVGKAPKGPINVATFIYGFDVYQDIFGGLSRDCKMSYAVYQFFQNGGKEAIIVRVDVDEGLELNQEVLLGNSEQKTGLYALEEVDVFNMLCIPAFDSSEDTRKNVYNQAMEFCEKRRAILIVDPPRQWTTAAAARQGIENYVNRNKNAAIYFPRIRAVDPLDGSLRDFDPCGAVAGTIARNDYKVGVWKANAGIDTKLIGIVGYSLELSDKENSDLNLLGINCLRTFPDAGMAVWGARTMRGIDTCADQWKYNLPVRRLALFIEDSLFRGTQWVIFEPNNERLWSQIRLNVGAFMQSLFIKGAFQGTDPKKAYIVKCGSETTTQTDIDSGIVNIIVGFAPLKPAEFIILKIQQQAGRISE